MLKLTNLEFSETLELGNYVSVKGGNDVDIDTDLSVDVDWDIDIDFDQDQISVESDLNPNVDTRGITGVFSFPEYDYLNLECSVTVTPGLSEVSGSLFQPVDGPIYLNV